MAKIWTPSGVYEDEECEVKLWQEDGGSHWVAVREVFLRSTGESVRREAWVSYKAEPVPAAGAIGEM